MHSSYRYHHVGKALSLINANVIALLLWFSFFFLPVGVESFSPQRRHFGNDYHHLPSSSSMSNATDSSLPSSLDMFQLVAITTGTKEDVTTSIISALSSSSRREDRSEVTTTTATKMLSLLGGRLGNALISPIRQLRRLWRSSSRSLLGKPGATGTTTTTNHQDSLQDSPSTTVMDGGHETTTGSSTGITTDRTATASIDLSGTWDLIVTPEFQNEYDLYLRRMGQPFLVRSVAINVIGLSTEETEQTNHGRALVVRSKNVKGLWERTLIASGPDDYDDDEANHSPSISFQPIVTQILTADQEPVLAEAWWENNGTIHHSWLRGVQKYGGGSFESIRYLEQNGNVLVCESTFHPNDPKRKKATVTWKFQRQGT